ncbi:putative huntingtin interacting protein (HIP) [Leishmania braziliensis MHOM/BR/75/M2904]|uniref:Huntingtin interacting protein (HIP) n=2 Tax=Leishmania braziliensis TaxID=5660 RepID=A4H3X2_LEIBR|nr:putative huntingtin interacting protein (HIP) [Leishmania braziliensis MHOM/BR/75/M2904]CAJ2466092.1 unnamed protein product [Leishmania braziliensis]CAM41534.1 putative huntingtin interacting protein (HIP) [Leishmania braziliensis MHOM/BR/75/M2904]SYZ62626.1 palmitoyl_acyltransferase_1 [Leishmania braziliensis MHOM/BR/75/M2904]
MLVFRDAIAKNGGPLPLLYYLQPDAGDTPDRGAAQYRGKSIDLLNTRVDRRTFFECVLNDADFATLTTFMMSGVPINATRDEDGASALHVAAAGTLKVLNDDDSQGGGSSGQATGCKGAGGRSARECHTSTDEEEVLADDGEESGGSTGRVLGPLCKNRLIISFLIDNGADVNAAMRGGKGQTPLMVAAARQNTQTVKLLLEKGADVNVQDAQGLTVLSYAVAYPLVMEALRLWIGEEVFYAAAMRERLLHTACRSLGNTYAALYLIEEIGLDVHMSDGNGAAAATGTPATVLYGQASPAGASSPQQDCVHHHSHTPNTASMFFAGDAPDGMRNAESSAQSSANSVPPTTNVTIMATAKHLAHPPSAGVGSAGGAAVEAINMRTLHNGDTPLHYAVNTFDVALVRALLSKGADVHAANYIGTTPLQLAQSQSSFAQSWKQYWKDELIVWLRPTSASAAAARRRRRERQHDRNPSRVRALLRAFSRANTTSSREKVLCDDPALHLWQLSAPMDAVLFVATATLPHILFYVCCCIVRNFFVLLCPLPLMYASYLAIQRRDSHRAGSRPLSSLGWCMGFILAQGLCLLLYTMYYCIKHYSVNLEDHNALIWWLFPSVTATAVLTVYVVLFSSAGLVTSSEGQRKGIYASLRGVKGDYPKSLLYGMDLRSMVKKPLRAQYCPQLQRVVLRYDHFCTHLSTAIGGGNHRAFVWLQVALLSTLCCFYYYAYEYRHLVSSAASVARAVAGVDRVALAKFEVAPFATAGGRFAYMYSQVILPLMILMTAYALCTQLYAIARNLTLYDLAHSEDESSVYCFTLGDVVYSLFDNGMWANLREFFGRSSLTQQVYRVPQINPYLEQLIKDHQRWQLTNVDNCCDGHDHQHQSCSHASSGDHSCSAAAPTGATSATTTMGKLVDPAEWGAHESGRAQQTLRAQQQEQHSVSQAERGREEECGADEYYGDDNGDGGSAMAMNIFQEMVRSGLTDVERHDAIAAMTVAARGGGGGADAKTQQEWNAAVEKAKQMYRFYLKSIGGSGADV